MLHRSVQCATRKFGSTRFNWRRYTHLLGLLTILQLFALGVVSAQADPFIIIDNTNLYSSFEGVAGGGSFGRADGRQDVGFTFQAPQSAEIIQIQLGMGYSEPTPPTDNIVLYIYTFSGVHNSPEGGFLGQSIPVSGSPIGRFLLSGEPNVTFNFPDPIPITDSIIYFVKVKRTGPYSDTQDYGLMYWVTNPIFGNIYQKIQYCSGINWLAGLHSGCLEEYQTDPNYRIIGQVDEPCIEIKPSDGSDFDLTGHNSTATAIIFSASEQLGQQINWELTLEYRTSGDRGPFTDNRMFTTAPNEQYSEQYTGMGGLLKVRAGTPDCTAAQIQVTVTGVDIPSNQIKGYLDLSLPNLLRQETQGLTAFSRNS